MKPVETLFTSQDSTFRWKVGGGIEISNGRLLTASSAHQIAYGVLSDSADPSEKRFVLVLFWADKAIKRAIHPKESVLKNVLDVDAGTDPEAQPALNGITQRMLKPFDQRVEGITVPATRAVDKAVHSEVVFHYSLHLAPYS